MDGDTLASISGSEFLDETQKTGALPPNVIVGDTQNVSKDAQGKDVNWSEFFQFTSARMTLQQIRDAWRQEIIATEGRRKLRDIEIDPAALRESGELLDDETLLPVRMIDTNIKREQPPYINYLRTSRRLAIFKCLSNPDLDSQTLEQAFTEGMSYEGWEKPFFKVIDGAQTHGWDAIEVTLDDNKPLHIAHEQIGHDRLFFSYDSLDLQNCSRILRAYDVTIKQLDDFVVEFGFNPTQVQVLKSSRQNTGERSERTYRIFKLYFKYMEPGQKQACVYVAWFSLDQGTSDWLKEPIKLFMGRRKQVMVPMQSLQPQPVTSIHPETQQPQVTMEMVPVQTMQPQWQDEEEVNYPIFILPYQETEKPRITDHKGRCFLDVNKQEAQTAILTGFVNGITRASNVYASPKQDLVDGGPLKAVDQKLVNGAILSKPLDFWSPPYPDPMIIRALQYLDSNNTSETGDIAATVLNRPDARKTATELSQAQQESQKLDSVQLVLLSTFLRAIFSYDWLIVQSLCMQGLLPTFLLNYDPESQQPKQDTGLIQQQYDVRAAGDVDVVQKNELVQGMMQDWPVIQNTPLAQQFLIDLIKLKYPNDANRYEAILRNGDPKMQVIQGLATALTNLVSPEEIKQLPEKDQAQLKQLAMATQQVLNPQQAQQQSQQRPPNNPQAQHTQPQQTQQPQGQ